MLSFFIIDIDDKMHGLNGAIVQRYVNHLELVLSYCLSAPVKTRLVILLNRFCLFVCLFACLFACFFACLMVFNATFNNISVISWRSVLLVEETGGPGENHRPIASH